MRSGTYSLSSPKFKLSNKIKGRGHKTRKKINRRDFTKKLPNIIKKYNLKCSTKELSGFLIESIKLREYLKFNFSKTISKIFCKLRRNKLFDLFNTYANCFYYGYYTNKI